MFRADEQFEFHRFRLAYASVLILSGLSLGLARYAFVAFRNEPLNGDARTVWYPVAQKVLDGVPLYLGPLHARTWDNKPPLFQFLNLGIAATDMYALVFLVLVGLANGVSAVLLWRLIAKYGRERIGIVASILFLGTLAHAGSAINPRPFATVAILTSLLLSSYPARSGLSIAVAGLFTQFSVLAIPVIVWEGIRSLERKTRYRWLVRFCASGLIAVVLSYLAVLYVWGMRSFVNGLYFTMGLAGSYVVGNPSLWESPIYWIGGTMVHATNYLHVLIPAVLGGWITVSRFRSDGRWTVEFVCFLLAVLLMLPLVIRPGIMYWFSPLPFLSVLAVVGFKYVLVTPIGEADSRDEKADQISHGD